MDLIPGLPNDVAIECLIRIHFQSLPASSKVSRGWKDEIERPEFCHRRKSIGSIRKIILAGQNFGSGNLVACCDLETGEWSNLPPIPDLTIKQYLPSLPVRVGSKIVAFGTENSVFIFNFLSGIWRRGTPMPGDETLCFSCASDSDQMLYVAGGLNMITDTLSSRAFAYNVAKDEWTKLPNMNCGHFMCTGTFDDGMFSVIGGRIPTTIGHQLCVSKATFDVAMWRWNPLELNFVEYTLCSAICVSSPHDGKMYMCQNGYVSVREGATWRVVARLPEEVCCVNEGLATASPGKLFVIGSNYKTVSPRVHVMDLKSYTWTSIEAPENYISRANSLCYMEI